MNRDKTSFLPLHHRNLEAVNFLLLLNGAIQDSVDRGPNKNPKSNFLSEGMLFYNNIISRTDETALVFLCHTI